MKKRCGQITGNKALRYFMNLFKMTDTKKIREHHTYLIG